MRVVARLRGGHRPPGTTWIIAVLLAVLVGGCTAGRAALNAQLPVIEASVDGFLARDDLASAEPLARDLERRLPGVDTYALLGRVLWRTGHLLDAEGFHRRSATGNIPEAILGLARAEVARGDLDVASDRLEPLFEADRVAARAWRLAAAIALARDDTAAAVAALREASSSPANPRASRDMAEAAALDSLTRARTWTGEYSSLVVAPDGTMEGQIDGRPARVRLALRAPRSVIARRWIEGSAALHAGSVTLGEVSTEAVFEVRELPEGVDAVLGFDLMDSLSWALDVAGARFEAAPRAAPLMPRGFVRTHWTHVRIPRDGLAVQLLAAPRIDGVVMTALLDTRNPTRLDWRAFEGRDLRQTGGPVEVEVRLGGWRGTVAAAVGDLYLLGRDAAVAPRAVLGEEVLDGWRIVWVPGARQLALERHTDADR